MAVGGDITGLPWPTTVAGFTELLCAVLQVGGIIQGFALIAEAAEAAGSRLSKIGYGCTRSPSRLPANGSYDPVQVTSDLLDCALAPILGRECIGPQTIGQGYASACESVTA